LKDAFMQKVPPVPSCLADFSEASVNLPAKASKGATGLGEGCRQVRRSAAMIGLAISMSATGILLSSQRDSAIAQEYSVPEVEVAILPPTEKSSQESSQPQRISQSLLSSSNPSPSERVKLAPPAIKHEVQQGESLWQLSQDYQVSPEAIAASNNIAPKANLLVGQTLKIPSEEGVVHTVKKLETIGALSQSYGVESHQLLSPVAISPSGQLLAGASVMIPGKVNLLLQQRQNSSLNQLRASRKQLKNSLAELGSQESNPQPPLAVVPAEVTTAAQPPRSSPASPDFNGAIEIPVPMPETRDSLSLDRPNKILSSQGKLPHPTAETNIPSVVNRRLSTAVKTSSPDSQPESLPQTTVFAPAQDRNANRLNSPIPNSSPKSEPTSSKQGNSHFDSGVAIPVPIPETANISNFGSNETRIILPAPKNNIQQPEVISPPASLSPLPRPKSLETSAKQVYQVRQGDTLNSIAHRNGLSVTELIEANGIRNPNLIKTNQQLLIPKTVLNQNTRPTPTTIAYVPSRASEAIAKNSLIPHPPLPLAIGSVSSATRNSLPTDARAQEVREQDKPNDTAEIQAQSYRAPYTEQLKADIINLQQEHQGRQNIHSGTQTSSIPSVTAAIDIPVPLPDRSVDSEWNSNRQQLNPQKQPQSYAPLPRVSKRLASQPSNNPEQLVGVAPTGIDNYNQMLQSPVGETVGPDLPPLSVPDRYLPDSPARFNGYIWPTKGVLTSGFGWRWGRMHKGVDIAAPVGTPVMAAAAGEVISAGWNSGGYGNLVKIRHPDDSVTVYAHNSRILVRPGQTVEQGQQISEMGSTGFSTGPHLHFEVHPNGQRAVNPIAYLPSK
jgi:murein DD-endopeptidase MepM/ murein hydrolase activator NlpD